MARVYADHHRVSRAIAAVGAVACFALALGMVVNIGSERGSVPTTAVVALLLGVLGAALFRAARAPMPEPRVSRRHESMFVLLVVFGGAVAGFGVGRNFAGAVVGAILGALVGSLGMLAPSPRRREIWNYKRLITRMRQRAGMTPEPNRSAASHGESDHASEDDQRGGVLNRSHSRRASSWSEPKSDQSIAATKITAAIAAITSSARSPTMLGILGGSPCVRTNAWASVRE